MEIGAETAAFFGEIFYVQPMPTVGTVVFKCNLSRHGDC